MAHPCCICDSECYCNGSIDDVIVDLTPKNCRGCDSCEVDAEEMECMREEDEYIDDDDPDGLDDSCPRCHREYDEIDREYQICHHCKFNNDQTCNQKPATGN